jgi:hypothetical protein
MSTSFSPELVDHPERFGLALSKEHFEELRALAQLVIFNGQPLPMKSKRVLENLTKKLGLAADCSGADLQKALRQYVQTNPVFASMIAQLRSVSTFGDRPSAFEV